MKGTIMPATPAQKRWNQPNRREDRRPRPKPESSDIKRWDRPSTWSWLMRQHWALVERGDYFANQWAAAELHAYFCTHTRECAPVDERERQNWSPQVPGAKEVAEFFGWSESNTQRAMKKLRDLGLLDLGSGYKKPRLRSMAEEEEVDRQRVIAEERAHMRKTHGMKRTAEVRGPRNPNEVVFEDIPAPPTLHSNS